MKIKKILSLILTLVMVVLMIPFSAFAGGAAATQAAESPVELDDTAYNTLYSIDFRKITNISDLSAAGWVLTADQGVTANANTFKYSANGLSYATQKNVNFTCGAVPFNTTDNFVVDYTFQIADSPRVVYMHFNATDTNVYAGTGSNSERWIFRGTDGVMAWDSSKFYDVTYTNCLSSGSTGNLKEVSEAAATAVLTDKVDLRIRIFVIRGESKYAVIDVPNVGQYYVLDAANKVVDGSYFSFTSCDNYTDARRLLLKDFSIHTYSTREPVVPTDVKYELHDADSGYAEGKVTVKLAEEHNTEKLAFYWGDSEGKLKGYDSFIGSVSVTTGTREATYKIDRGLIIPSGATKLLVYPHGKSGEGAICAETDLPSGSNYLLPSESPLTEFYVISDTHWGRNATCEAQTQTALEYIAQNNPEASGIFIVGDMINGGDLKNGGGTEKAQYESFYNAWSSISNLPDIYPVAGNHEFFGWYKDGSCDNQGYMDAFVENITDYYEHIELEDGWNKPYYDVTVDGFNFIILGGTKAVSSEGWYLGDEQCKWLEEKLENIPSDQPVFIMLHTPLEGSVAVNVNTGKDSADDTKDGAKVKAILDKYPNAVVFHGHTHFSFLNDNYKHMSGGGDKYVAFNDSSIRDNVSGYLVSVYKDRTLVRGIDFEAGEWIASAQFVVNERIVEDFEDVDTIVTTAATTTYTTTAPTSSESNNSGASTSKGCKASSVGVGVVFASLAATAIVSSKRRSLKK